MIKKTHTSDIDLLKRLLPFMKEHWGRILSAMLCMIGVASATSAIPLLIKPVIDDIFINKNMVMLKLLPLAIVGIYATKGVCYFGQAYIMEYVGQNIIKQIRDKLYAHLQDLPLSFFSGHKTGILMARITNDVNLVKGMVSNAITGAVKDFFTLIGLLCAVFYRDWKLATIAVIFFPVAISAIVKFGRRLRKASIGCQEAIADMNVHLHETFTGQRIVKIFGMEGYEENRFIARTLSLLRFEMKAAVTRSISPPVMELLAAFSFASIIWYGGSAVIRGDSTAGTFFSFMAAVIMLYDPVKQLSAFNNTLQAGLSATVRVYDLMDITSEIQEKENAVKLPCKQHTITFQNAFFKYENDLILKDINLHANPGEVVAIVGMSGGGKTSLVNLIPRFYDVYKGSIMIDGTDVRDISISSLRKEIAMVSQDPMLFNDTIRNNILYGNLNASDNEIIEAAKASYAYDFIKALPNGFETNAGEMGTRLSGGEKQRICIARALLKNAPILILDEATSSLDSESELAVQQALENLMKGRTTFVIAHRLSTVRNADKIVVLSGGRIVEQGKHVELFALKGEYFRLYELQFRNSN
ncbi:MAG: ABC transporter transmembrane domain-containing protein [Pseudomonadota bacterium]